MNIRNTISTLLLLLLSLGVSAQIEESQIFLADPYILLEDGIYYAYGTQSDRGINCYKSEDLKSWQFAGLALDMVNTTESKWFWAPEVYHIGDRYLMYYSANEHLFVAQSQNPTGPFYQIGGYMMENLLGSEQCIDSSLYIDKDGTPYLFFVRFVDGNCIWQCQLQEDCITPIPGTLKLCLKAEEPWERIQAKVAEGPNVLRKGKKVFLSYSANDYQSQDYAVGYATTENVASGQWSKNPGNPILHRWEGQPGTGHHSFFRDKNGKLRIVYHTHFSEQKIHPRRMYIGTATIRKGKLQMKKDPIIVPLRADEIIQKKIKFN